MEILAESGETRIIRAQKRPFTTTFTTSMSHLVKLFLYFGALFKFDLNAVDQ